MSHASDGPSGRRTWVLLVEDNPGDARLVRELFQEGLGPGPPVQLIVVERLGAALDRLADPAVDVDAVLLDLTLPDSRGLETFERVHRAAPALPVVVLSGQADEALALQAVQAGAQDYLVKGQVDGGGLVRALRYAIERARLEALRRDLERQRDELFASVSHDLRTPVAAIKAAVGVVLATSAAELPDPTRRLLGNIDLAADELAELIEDLLAIARLQAGRVELWRTRVDLRDVVARAVRPLESMLAARQQQLRLDLSAAPVWADVDVDRLGRVIRNLVGNAQKYGRAGGRVELVLATDGLAESAVLDVRDNGPGIAPADLAHIFDRFYRAPDARAAGAPGSGLGLPIAQGLVELHGGQLTVESEPGVGSVFRVRLPLAELIDRDLGGG